MNEAYVIGLFGILAFFILASTGIPVAVCLLIPAFVGIYLIAGPQAALVKIYAVPFTTVANYGFGVLPLFVFMASIIAETGMGKDLFNMAHKWIGHLPGGLAQATIVACAIMAAVTAYAWASITSVGKIAIPEMKRYNYNMKLAAGAVAAGSELGDLIPPSGTLIIYGILTGTSIGACLIAGIIPGILLTGFYIAVIFIICRIKPDFGPRGPDYPLKEKISSVAGCFELIVLVILLLGGLFLGWFTPTEAGAVGASGAVLIATIRRRTTWNMLNGAIIESAKLAGMIYLLMCSAIMFKDFATLSTLPFWLKDFVMGFHLPGIAVMGIIIIIYLILGCIIDTLSMVLLTINIFLPIVVAAGFDPVWFGIIVVRSADIGLLTPPMGMSVFFLKGMFPDLKLTEMFKGVFYFLYADIAHVALILAFPVIVLFLPRLMHY